MKINTLLAALLLSAPESAMLAQDHYSDMMHAKVAAYRAVVRKDPRSAQAQERLAVALYEINYRQSGNVVYTDLAPPSTQDEAIPHLKTSLLGLVKPFPIRRGGPSDQMQVAQSTFSSHYLLGDALVKLGAYQEAEAQYDQALRFDPSADWVLLGFGNALNGGGQRLQARAAWQKIISHSPRPTFYTRQAHIKLAKYPA